ncbi:HAD family hydrolase [Verrucomicrobiaceae bacterium N1E253]|uniref:phosphoglycolate phosphatase n=1 Tax=Oceaniferula marina TaxID=2748318 RepID=A0A851GA10_9BACT|nr:HAD family hydrolase [Oceaniferula marina]NWK54049.1 HAD family hydrolase [Oceaniferula marina]
MIRSIIFDLDGTLVHSLPGLARALNRVLQKHKLPTHPEAVVRGFIGDGIKKLVERACPADYSDEQIQLIEQDMVKAYADTWQTGSPPFTGIIETLDQLKKRGIPLAIFSNKPHHFCQEFAEFLFPGTFMVVIGQREGVPVKPDPTGALETAALLGIPAEDTAFVGDSTMDIATAHNAGMLALAATWGYHNQDRLEKEHPHHLLHDITELIPLLESLN